DIDNYQTQAKQDIWEWNINKTR
ncbi:unnamed protein product, partial [Allacma fusca]